MGYTTERAPSSLYERDFVRWAKQQAAELRRLAERDGNSPLEPLNLAEEIEGLARRDQRSLSKHVCTVLEHLLKLRVSPATHPRTKWERTLEKTRNSIERLLTHSPSLLREIPKNITEEIDRARDLAALSLQEYSEPPREDVRDITFTAEDVLNRDRRRPRHSTKPRRRSPAR